MKMLGNWYNYRTKQYEARDTPDGDEWLDYISQEPPAQALYRLYVLQGVAPIEAAKNALTAMIPTPQEEPTTP
jgi:hypothetical protein